ncbi:MAG: hypothetical protein ASARMPREDX12_009035 [Alectoria sarmentosa]|nr:MAG: hypothetical protein ASARMPREDX12_009035 [Alectoria sarmentosa]
MTGEDARTSLGELNIGKYLDGSKQLHALLDVQKLGFELENILPLGTTGYKAAGKFHGALAGDYPLEEEWLVLLPNPLESNLPNTLSYQLAGNAVDDHAHFRTCLPPLIFDKLFDIYAIARFHLIGLSLLEQLDIALSTKNLRSAHTDGQANTSSIVLTKCIPTTQSSVNSVETHTDPGTLLILFNPPPSLHLFRPADPEKPESKPRYIPISPPPGSAAVIVGDALSFLSRGRLHAAQMCMMAAKGMENVDEWHSVAYRLGPDEKATLVDLEKVKWPAGDWHAARMGVEADETL